MSLKGPFSHHIFLFSFQWDLKKKPKKIREIPFNDRTSLKDLGELMEGQLNQSCKCQKDPSAAWKPFVFELTDPKHYNELVYFYPYVHDVLFDTVEVEDKILLQYSYELGVEPTFNFSIKNKVRDYNNKVVDYDTKEYSLDITDITLNFYLTGIGVLAFHLDNNLDTQNSFEDILLINDYGRRIFPQYLSIPNEAESETQPTDSVKDSFLPHTIVLKNKDGNITKTEDFSFYSNSMGKARLPHHIQQLLGCKFKVIEEEVNVGEVFISQFGDDRMFTLSWFANNPLVAELQKSFLVPSSPPIPSYYEFEVSPKWYSYVFVDGKIGNGIANNQLMYEDNKKHTYARWIDYGTLFGLTNYSFVALVKEGDFGKKQVLSHIQTVYFQLIILCLVQRFSILRFANETPRLSSFKKDEIDKYTELVEDLQEKYVKFINKMYFREVTPQLQGMEIYTKMIEVLKIERDVKDLNREIDELFQNFNFKSTKIVDDKLRSLTMVVSMFAIPSFLAGYLGMNLFGEDNFSSFFNKLGEYKYLCAGGAFSVVAAFSYVAFLKKITVFKWSWKIPKIVKYSATVLLIILALLILLIPFINENCF